MASLEARDTKAYAVTEAGGPVAPFVIKRRQVTDNDVAISIKFAGICHTDIHRAKNEWGPSKLPLVPGHEIGGHVVAVGKNVKDFIVGEPVGVGCLVESCRNCNECKEHEENYCNDMVLTYNSSYKVPHSPEYNAEGGNPTYGGFSQYIVVDRRFVYHIAPTLDLAAATPLLCAGITTYAPMARFGLKAGHKVAIVGLGGLGHIAVKLAVAFGAHVTVISRGKTKREDAINGLKAHAYLDSTDPEALKAATASFNLIIDTVSAQHDLNVFLNLLTVNGKLSMVGADPQPFPIGMFGLIFKRRSIEGSLIGGTKQTQEMLDFCAKHNIVCDIEKINPDYINTAFERVQKSDVKFRFVIDTTKM